MSDGQGDVQRTIDADNTRTGPPLAYQATGGADWQSKAGWGYQPLNEAAVDHRTRRVAADLQQLANAVAAVGRGRGRYPEWSDEMASLARRMVKWAGEMEGEAKENA
jgi:hypothetical protein